MRYECFEGDPDEKESLPIIDEIHRCFRLHFVTPDKSLPQNDRSGSFAEELKDKTKETLEQASKEIGNILLN